MRPLTVALISYVVYASEDCAAEQQGPKQRSRVVFQIPDKNSDAADRRPVDCYECATYTDPFCGDPFNASVADKQRSFKRCDGACAKWVRKPKYGPVHYIRTCSKNINMQMAVALVCMKESRPGDGRLCFCGRDLCNSAPTRQGASSSSSRYAALLFGLLTLLLVSVRHAGPCHVPVTWRTDCDDTSASCIDNGYTHTGSDVSVPMDALLASHVGYSDFYSKAFLYRMQGDFRILKKPG